MDTFWLCIFVYANLNCICTNNLRKCSSKLNGIIFKASALWADAFYKLKCPSVCPCVRVFVCLFTFEVPFNGIFSPTSRSRMSNIFRDSESLGKSNGMKWSQIWKFVFENCLKSPLKKKFFSLLFFGLLRFLVFFKGLIAPTSQSRMSNILRDSESLGKSNGKKWSQIWTFMFENGIKSPRKKKFFSSLFFGLLRFLVFFNGLFAPTSQSWMSNIFRDSESWEKSNGKKWSQIWTFLFENCLKSPRKKN